MARLLRFSGFDIAQHFLFFKFGWRVSGNNKMDLMENDIKIKKIRCGNDIYKCDRFLGKGGFGSCYSFKTERSDCIAVKVIDKKQMKLKSICRECDILKRLEHENIVRYFSRCEDNGYSYIIMEMCDKSLHYILQTENDFIPIIKVQKYARDILRGLCYLHNQGIVHRDIKTNNILISKDDVAKIGDFGLSRELEELERSKRQTFCGSYYYLAPEIITDFRYTTCSDIWSFGVLLYRLTTGRYPFIGNYGDLFYRIEHIIFQRCAALNMNKNGRRLIQLFCYIFRPLDRRLHAQELLNRSFFTKPLVPEDEVSKETCITDEVVSSCTITTCIPRNVSKTINTLLGNMYNDNAIENEEATDFVYLVSYLDYTNSYGLMYYLSNNLCGFWYFDQSTIFRYSGSYYQCKYFEGKRYFTPNQTISQSKQIRFKILLNELLSPEGQIDDGDSVMPEPIFIDYWIQTIEYFIIILSNGTVHIEMFRNFRGHTCDTYIIDRAGRLYIRIIRNDEMHLRPLSSYERELFFKGNPRIMEILSKLAAKD